MQVVQAWGEDKLIEGTTQRLQAERQEEQGTGSRSPKSTFHWVHPSPLVSAPQELPPLTPLGSQPWHAPGRGSMPGQTCAEPAHRLCVGSGRLLPLLTAGCVSARHSSSSTICSGFTPSWGQSRESRTGLCLSAWEESRAAGRVGSGWQGKLCSPQQSRPTPHSRWHVLPPTNTSHVQVPS